MLSSLFVRFYKIDTPLADWHSWRQTATASVAELFKRDGIDLMHPRTYDVSTAQTGYYNPQALWLVEMPIYGAFHSIASDIFINIDFVVIGRTISIFASLVSGLIIYLISRKYLGLVGGLLSAFFYLFIPYNIFYSRVILPEPLAVAFGLSSIWFFIRYTDQSNIKWLYFSASLFAVSILIKPFTIFYSVPIVFLAYKKHGIGFLKNKRLLLYVLVALLPLIAWRFWISQFPEGIPHTKWAFNGDGIRFRPAFWRWLFGERLGKLILGTWGLIPFAYGIITKHKNKGFVLSFLFGSFLFISIFATANVRHDYYQIVIIPSVSLALALGFIAMWNSKTSSFFLAKGLLLFSTIMMFGLGWFQVREYYKINHPEIVQAGMKVDELVPKDALVVAPYNKDIAFLYQTKRFGWPFIDGSLDNLIEKGAKYYVSVNYDPFTLEVMEKYKVIEQTESYVIVELK